MYKYTSEVVFCFSHYIQHLHLNNNTKDYTELFSTYLTFKFNIYKGHKHDFGFLKRKKNKVKNITESKLLVFCTYLFNYYSSRMNNMKNGR